MSDASITFYGGVGTVTGSKALIESDRSAVLLDCGLFQGLSALRRRNWEPPAFNVRDVDAVVLTHAHLDHSGYLPLLVRHGWHGKVYCTDGTTQLAEVVLRDSAHLQEEEARQANEGGWTKHSPAMPLYDSGDAERACRLLSSIPYGKPVEIVEGIRLTLGRAGHILGSSWAKLDIDTDAGVRTVVASGDLGRPNHPLLAPPDPRPFADALLIESTYGNRRHERWDCPDRLGDAIRRTAHRGGSVLIPAFAVDRTEMLLHYLMELKRAGKIPDLPIVLDSPMALSCLQIYRQAVKEHWPELRPELTEDELFDIEGLVEIHSAQASAHWNDPRQPAIIISASGMASGGRVLHHLRHMLPDHKHSVIIVGFAAAGTRARQLADGARQVKIHGRYVPVRAEVLVMNAMSAHADCDELYDWATAQRPPTTCYVVHGEPPSSHELAARLHEGAGWTAVVPTPGERVLI